MNALEQEYSDYIVYVDESGDHSMDDMNKLYPAFVLAFCVFSKREYLEEVVKHIKHFKFAFWGHDMTILHSSKLRKQINDFQFLNNQIKRAFFIENLNIALNKSPFEIIATAIDKRYLKESHAPSANPYDLGLEHCIREIYQFLGERKQDHKLTHIIIESRGKKEDSELEIAFQKIVNAHCFSQIVYPLKLVFADKKTNSIGLQLADLVAYPIGRFLINPEQENLAFDIVEKKLHRHPEHYGSGLKIIPNTEIETYKKRKTSDLSEV